MVVSWWLGQRCWVGEVVGGYICAREGRFSSLCGCGAGVVFSGNELAASEYARVRRGEGWGVSCARGGMGMGFLCEERTKGDPLHGVSWLRADGFFLCVVRVGSSAPHALLALDVRTLAVPINVIPFPKKSITFNFD